MKRVVSSGTEAVEMSAGRRVMFASAYCLRVEAGRFEIVDWRWRRVMGVLLRSRWVMRLLSTSAPSSPAPRMRMEVVVVGIVVCWWV